MKPGTQFKIESIEELKEAYEKLSHWQYEFEEIKEFYAQGNFWIKKNSLGNYYLGCRDYDKETIPNPFKKHSWQRIKKTLDDIGCHNLDEEESGEDKESLILEELNNLRKEVDKIRRIVYPKGGVYVDRVFIDEKEEKPKESPDLKIKWNHCELELIKYVWSNHLTLKIDDSRDEVSIPIEKPEAIKLVDYLKKHFEI